MGKKTGRKKKLAGENPLKVKENSKDESVKQQQSETPDLLSAGHAVDSGKDGAPENVGSSSVDTQLSNSEETPAGSGADVRRYMFNVSDVLPPTYKGPTAPTIDGRGKHTRLLESWDSIKNHLEASPDNKLLVLTPPKYGLKQAGLQSFGVLHNSEVFDPELGGGHGRISYGYVGNDKFLKSLPPTTKYVFRSVPKARVRQMPADEAKEFARNRKRLDTLVTLEDEGNLGRVMIPCRAFSEILKVTQPGDDQNKDLDKLYQDLLLDVNEAGGQPAEEGDALEAAKSGNSGDPPPSGEAAPTASDCPEADNVDGNSEADEAE
jgi:hypothetical protein